MPDRGRGREREASPAAGAVAASRRSPFNIPNTLSILRLPMAAAFFAVESTAWRGAILSAAALSDALDGWLARRFGQQSRAGVILDPMFDKLFVTIVLAAFLAGPSLEWPEFLVLLSRDLYISVAFIASRLLGLAVPIYARLSGKTVTVLQLLSMFVLLFAPRLIAPFVAVVGVASVIAIVDYTTVGIAALQES
jgi:phosphatidylglycerophosphate synthase